MPLPVIADVYRCTLKFNRAEGVAPVNVLNVSAPASNATDVGAKIVASLTNAMFTPCTTDLTVISVDVLKLDGTSATVSTPDGAHHGLQTSGSQVVPSTAAVISLRTTQRGARGRGRVFVGPVTEGSQANGILDATMRDAMTAAWQAFEVALDAGAPVVQLSVASYKHLDHHPVLALHCDSALGTQRRRQNQVR